MLSAEVDEAGRLRAFRERFGRGWDADAKDEGKDGGEGEGEGKEGGEGVGKEMGEGGENLMDLISGFGREGEGVGEGKKKKGGGRKGGKR